MNFLLDNAEQVLLRQVAKVVADEIREHVVRDLSQSPVLWSRQTTAYMIGGEQDHASVRYVDELIAEGEIETFKSGRNGGGRAWVVPESVEAWKQRQRNMRRLR